MQQIRFAIDIDAPRDKVWNTALQDATYRQWTTEFNPRGSWFDGDWNQGSKILFLGPGEDGKIGGMVSRIHTSRPYEFLSIEHLGMIQDGVEDLTSDAVKNWTPAFENYTFKDQGGRTEMIVEMDVDESFRASMEEMWPRALQKLKTLAEK
jgi:uncharacterized protein YndB with AHSA1/START domain